jgi:ribonuclease T2
MRPFAGALCVSLAFPLAPPAEGPPGGFDFYVLALSWSPTFCATREDATESPQCDGGTDHGFIVHGLWPQYEDGYPEFCGEAGRLSSSLVESVLDIIPDRGLAEHEWAKHGTCSGLASEAYFTVTRAAFEGVSIPPRFRSPGGEEAISAASVEAAFTRANPGLDRDELAVECEDGRLSEVRICLTRDLRFRSCGEIDRRGCRAADVHVPAPQ